MIRGLFERAGHAFSEFLHGDPKTRLQDRIQREEERLGDDAANSVCLKKLKRELAEMERGESRLNIPASQL